MLPRVVRFTLERLKISQVAYWLLALVVLLGYGLVLN